MLPFVSHSFPHLGNGEFKAILLSIFSCFSVAPFKKKNFRFVLSIPLGSLTSQLAGLMFKTFLEG